MTTAHVYIATSLDGFIARPDGAIDWLVPFGEGDGDLGYGEFMSGMDAIVMGRGTFQTVLGFDSWPYTIPVIVMSRTLGPPPSAVSDKVEVTDQSPADLMETLAARGLDRVYVDGGQIVQAFLREGLIEDMILTRVPVLIGEGRPLFGPIDGDLALRHVHTQTLRDGMIQSRYARRAAPPQDRQTTP